MIEENEGKRVSARELEVTGIGHDGEGAYVEVSGGFGFSGVCRVRVGDTILLQDDRDFTFRVKRGSAEGS